VVLVVELEDKTLELVLSVAQEQPIKVSRVEMVMAQTTQVVVEVLDNLETLVGRLEVLVVMEFLLT
jgi:hypothetical protein